MASTYSTNLAIELIGTGDQAGSWGNTTNTNLGTLIEQAISGYVTQAVSTGTDTTITIPNGATGVARNMYIELTGTGGTNTNLIVPANKKLYFIFNNSTGAVTVKVSGQTGVSVPNGKKMVLVSNGTDVVVAENYIADFGSNSATITNLTCTSLTLSNNPTFSGGTANGVLYLNGSKVATSGSALTFDGTTVLTTPRINITNTGTGATFSSSGGSGMRLYGSSGTNQWDIYLNGANVRFSDNTGGGVVKIDTGAVIDGNVGIGTASPGEKLTVNGSIGLQRSGTQYWHYGVNASNAIVFTRSGVSDRLTLDSDGNLGLGVTPSAWSSFKAVQVGSGSLASTPSGQNLSIAANAYFDGTNWKYVSVSSAVASEYRQNGGEHFWSIAGAGTAGNNISWTTAMTLNASGNLGVGTTSPARRLSLNEAASTQVWTGYSQNNSEKMVVGLDASGNGNFLVTANAPAIFSTNNTERGRFTAGGYFKASDAGTYLGSTSSYHELRQSSATDACVAITATSGSYTSAVAVVQSDRAANAAFDLLLVRTSGGGDVEFNLRGDGNAYADGTWNNNGADYAEFFESATGGALTVGATVVLDGNKVREATAADPVSAIMGVVRPKEPGKASMVVGNTAWNKWANKYLTDDFDRYIMEDHDVVEWTDEDGKQHSYESHNIPNGVTVPADAVRKTHDDNGNKFQHYKLNPAWDKDAEYTPREKRDEWIIVGLVGQVKVLKGKPVNDRWIKMRDVSAAVEEWMIR